VLGGEVATDKNETNTGEIYDPVGNTWTVIANFPEANFGDGMSEVLSDGRVLAASEGSSNSYIYNPANNTWSGAIPSYLGDQFSEEGWVKLADGSLLDYQIGGGNPQGGARFVLGATDAQDAWVAAGNVPVRLDSNGGDNSIVPELGPGFRLPDGRVPVDRGDFQHRVLHTQHQHLDSRPDDSQCAGRYRRAWRGASQRESVVRGQPSRHHRWRFPHLRFADDDLRI